MGDNNNKPQDKSRRDFVRKSAQIGAGVTIGGAAIYAAKLYEEKKLADGHHHKMLMDDGTLKEIDPHTVKASAVRPEDLNDLQARGREGLEGKKFAMVIDLAKCRNAQACMAACQEAHEIRPEQTHINVLRMQDTEHTTPYFMPKPCYHCDNPPCVKVCPVDATFKRQDGIVLIDNERCIGCRFCVAGCPYSSRMFHWEEPLRKEGKPEDRPYDVELNVPQKKGTITKCLFSADRLREGKLPYCVSACPNGVYYFGDINQDAVTNGTSKETVRFSELIRENGGYTVMEELGTKPQVYYLPPRNRLFPFEYDGKTTIDNNDGHHS